MPIKPETLNDFLHKSCEQFRHKLVKEYDILIRLLNYTYYRIIYK